MEILTLVEALKGSLLYQMSLGNTELYHSNVWAWLFQNDHNFIKIFFDAYDEGRYEFCGAARECAHRDLIIWLRERGLPEREGKCYFVIENKIKSLADRAQLQNYSEDLYGNRLVDAAFTGIINPFDQDVIQTEGKIKATWRFVSYHKIAGQIEEIAAKSQSELILKNRAQIEEYCSMICHLVSVLRGAVELCPGRLEYWCGQELTAALEEIRLRDIFVKLKAASFVRFLKEREGELFKLCPKGYRLEIGQGFHRKSATIDVRFTDWEARNKQYLHLGIQLQGDQYRRIAERNGRFTSVEEVFHEFKGDWFDENYRPEAQERVIFGRPTRMRALYDSYGANSREYSFVYQYFDLDESSREFERLFQMIFSDMKLAGEVILGREDSIDP